MTEQTLAIIKPDGVSRNLVGENGLEVGRITFCCSGKTTALRFSAMVLPVTVMQSPCR